MSVNFISMLAVGVVAALGVASVVLVLLAAVRGRNKPPPEAAPVPTSLSLLAGLSFFSGLAAIALVVVAVILFAVLSLESLLQVNADARQAITLATKIVLYASLLPSVVAVAFALAARGVISESGGAVRGRPLYRTGILLAILSGAVVFDARIINPTTWASIGQSVGRAGKVVDEGRINRGYLGVEFEDPRSTRVVRVVPGSPADKAGIRAGDWIVKLGGPQPALCSLAEQIGLCKPGTRIMVELRRLAERIEVTVELAATFETLQAMLVKQHFDHERLSVLKAAGLDHRYSAEELTKICETFDFDVGRLKAIQPALPLLQDPQNAYQILGALEFSDAKSKVSGWITAVPKPPRTPQEE